MTVSNGLIEDKSTVLTWAEIRDVGDNIGNKEGFYCSIIYSQAESSGDSIEINTF